MISHLLNRIRTWLRSVLLRRRLEREMREEMSAHLARSEERLWARGMSAEEARRAALREFGNVDLVQEQARDARGGRGYEALIADVRFGIRHFSRTPFSTLTMIVLLALGIGFNTMLFTTIYSFVNMPPPGIRRDESLVRIRGVTRNVTAGRAEGREFSYPEYREHARQQGLFSAVTAWTSSDVVLGAGGSGEDLSSGAATYVTGNYFHVLGVRPILGRGLRVAVSPDDGAPELAAVISHAVWDRHFGRATEVIGRTVKVNDVPATVVGVAPRRFAGTRTGGSQMRVWLPLSARATIQRGGASALSSYDSTLFGIAARLRPGIDAYQTLPAVEAIAARADRQSVRPGPGTASADVVTLLGGNYFPPSGEQPQLINRLTSFLIPLLILLIPCTNVSTLLVGLAVARRREIAVRLSLGAVRSRIVRQLVTESMLLAVAAAVLGLCVIGILLNMFGARVPDLQLVLNGPAVAFTFGIALLTGILFGVSPALHATRVAVADVLKDSAAAVSASRSRLQSGLVVAQIAMTQPLLLGQGAMILSLSGDLRNLPAGPFNDRIMQISFNTNPRYGALNEEREAVLRELQERIAALPGVENVVPLSDRDGYAVIAVHPSDRMTGIPERETLEINTRSAPPGYFELMGFQLIRGRAFAPSDRHDHQSIIITTGLARRLWGSNDPIGRRLIHTAGGADATAFVVVGVVDGSLFGFSADGQQQAFVPTLGITGSFLVRTRGPAQPMIPLIRSIALTEAPSQPVTRVTTLATMEAGQRASIARLSATALTAGVIALFLCAIGLYAVVAFAVGQRTREIGIRTALGADPGKVARMFFLRGIRLSIVGLAIGLTLSIVAVRIMAAARGESPEPGTALLGVAVMAVVVGVAAIATWIPARRAARIDPLTALRAE